MLNVAMVAAVLSGLAIIVAVMLQKTKADGFSAAMGGGADSTRFTPGSKEEWLDKIARVAAVIWVIACLAVAILWYKQL